jgi:hypothetical protein
VDDCKFGYIAKIGKKTKQNKTKQNLHCSNEFFCDKFSLFCNILRDKKTMDWSMWHHWCAIAIASLPGWYMKCTYKPLIFHSFCQKSFKFTSTTDFKTFFLSHMNVSSNCHWQDPTVQWRDACHQVWPIMAIIFHNWHSLRRDSGTSLGTL